MNLYVVNSCFSCLEKKEEKRKRTRCYFWPEKEKIDYSKVKDKFPLIRIHDLISVKDQDEIYLIYWLDDFTPDKHEYQLYFVCPTLGWIHESPIYWMGYQVPIRIHCKMTPRKTERFPNTSFLYFTMRINKYKYKYYVLTTDSGGFLESLCLNHKYIQCLHPDTRKRFRFLVIVN